MCVGADECVFTNLCMCIYIYTYAHACTHVYACMYVCMYGLHFCTDMIHTLLSGLIEDMGLAFISIVTIVFFAGLNRSCRKP